MGCSKKSEGDTYLDRDDNDARGGAFFLAPDDLSDGFRSSSSLSAHQSFIVWCASQWGAARRARRVIGRRVADESLRFSRGATTRDANGRRYGQQAARTDPVSFLRCVGLCGGCRLLDTGINSRRLSLWLWACPVSAGRPRVCG